MTRLLRRAFMRGRSRGRGARNGGGGFDSVGAG